MNDCNKQFSQRGNVSRHKNFHFGDKAYECDDCTKKFLQSLIFVIQKRIHTGEKPHERYGCDISLMSNLTTSNGSDEDHDFSLWCWLVSMCPEMAGGSNAGTEVATTMVALGSRSLLCCGDDCNIIMMTVTWRFWMPCNRKFSNLSNLSRHKRIHHRDK